MLPTNRTNNDLARASGANTDEFTSAIRRMFASMKTFGRQLDSWTLEAYIQVLINIRATQAEIDAACSYLLENEEEVPTPHRLADRIKSEREKQDLREALRLGVEAANEAHRIEVETWLLDAFNTTTPSKEAIAERMRDNPIFEAVMSNPAADVRKIPPFEATPDPDKIAARDRFVRENGG
jgi:hypothetical protein